MSDMPPDTTQLQLLLDRIRGGDASARAELFERTCERLRKLAHRMVRDQPRVRRWEETGDVLQNALLRLHRALEKTQPDSVRSFFRLAALCIRRELLSLARHHLGPEGQGAHHATDGADSGPKRSGESVGDSTYDPGRLVEWAELHQQVEMLPDAEREVFGLLWYHEMSQAEAAAVLSVSERSVLRRWRSARLLLHERLKGGLPGG